MIDTPGLNAPAMGDWLKIFTPEKLDFVIRSCGFVQTLKLFDIESITEHDVKVMCRVLTTSYENLITELETTVFKDEKFDFAALLFGCRSRGIERTLHAIGDLNTIDHTKIQVISRTIVNTQEVLLDTLRDLMISGQKNK